MYKLTLLIGIFTSSVYSQQIVTDKQSINYYSTIRADSSYFNVNSEKRMENYWGIHLGYFPDTNDKVYTSHGFGAILNMENYSGSLFNFGWYFIIRNTFEDDGENQKKGSASLGASLSHHFSDKPNTFLIKVGLGLRSPPYVQISTLFVLEYQFQIFEGILLSIAITEEIIALRDFVPSLISLGIVL